MGAYGGRKDIMSLVAPAGPMYQAGTLSGNPLAMAAGIKTMEILSRPNSYEHLEKITSRLVSGILAAGKEYGHAVTGGSISGMFGFFFAEGPVNNFSDASKSDLKKFARWHRMMLERGTHGCITPLVCMYGVCIGYVWTCIFYTDCTYVCMVYVLADCMYVLACFFL